MTETSVLEVATQTVAFRGAPLIVSPLRVGQIPPFTRAVRPMFAALAGSLTSAPSDGSEGEGGEFQMPLDQLLDLITEHGEAMILAVSIATKVDQEKVADADPEEFFSLLRAVLEVNADFFARAVGKARAGAGQSPSSS